MIDILYLFAAFLVKLFRKKTKTDDGFSRRGSPAEAGALHTKDPGKRSGLQGNGTITPQT